MNSAFSSLTGLLACALLTSSIVAKNPSVLAASVSQRTLTLPEQPYRYSTQDWPAHFSTPAAREFDNTPEDNPITDPGANLGRILFYDTRLSANENLSCASCHEQKHAFTDPRRFSLGTHGQSTERNGMSLVNLRFTNAKFFWDERTATLEEQVLIPIQSKVEMGQNLDTLLEILRNDEHYPGLFKAAFGDENMTRDRLAKALAQFIRSLVSCHSKYDDGMVQVASAEEEFPNFTAQENLGKSLFLSKCAICHRDGRGSQSAFFFTFRSLNNGIDPTGEVPDGGNGDITLVPGDLGLFKPSSLRNIEHTAPYMHDGRFQTLEEVVEHYSTGVQRHPNVSGFVFRMHFTPEEKAALIAFLKTLSDPTFLTDPRFANPWSGQATDETATLEPQSPVTRSKSTAPLTAEQRAERLAAKQGLPPGETAQWLKDLDRDQNHSWSLEELSPLAQRLQENGIPPRFDRRRFRFSGGELTIARGRQTPPALMVYDRNQNGNVERAELPENRLHLLEVGDLDADETLNAEELRNLEIVERFLVLLDNGRDLTRVDRLLSSLRIEPSKAMTFRESLHTAQQDLQQIRAMLNRQLSADLESALGAEEYARFQDLLLVKQTAQEMARRTGDLTRETVQQLLTEFDTDQDGEFSLAELESLARVLEETPGGFGTVRQPLPDIQSYTHRIMAHDANRDGRLNEDEIPERLHPLSALADANSDGMLTAKELEQYLRETSYERFIAEGVYIGGGFVDAFTQSQRLLDELDLSEQSKAQAIQLLATREQEIQTALRKILVSEYARLRGNLTPGPNHSATP